MTKVLEVHDVTDDLNISFETWANEWLESVAQKNSPSTIRGYTGRVKFYLLPYFGDLKLSEITNKNILHWIEETSSEARNLVAIIQAHGVLKRILQHAVDRSILIKNPAAGTNIPKCSSIRVESLTFSQLIKLAEECEEYSLMILLAGTTGLKWGEIVGLRCRDVSILNHTLFINNIIIEGLNGKKTLVEVKNHQKRVIKFPKELQNDLDQILSVRGEDDFIFESPTKGILDYHNFMKRVYRPALTNLDLVNISFRSLRQTTAGLLAAQRTPITVLSKILGHSSLQITLNSYGHLYRSDAASFLEKVGKIVFSTEEFSKNSEMATISRIS